MMMYICTISETNHKWWKISGDDAAEIIAIVKNRVPVKTRGEHPQCRLFRGNERVFVEQVCGYDRYARNREHKRVNAYEALGNVG